MPRFSEHLQALAQATNWTSLTKPDAHGVVRVALEDNLDIVFFCLGEQFCLMRGTVFEFQGKESERESLCEKAARLQVAALRDKPSLVAYEEPGQLTVPGENGGGARLICYRCVPLSVDTDTFIEEVQDWLNDYAWWKANFAYSNDHPSTLNAFFSASPFSNLKL
ncbi:MAG: hypothetical protein K6G15_05995 [Desulfovibrio sp.]|nr:hypothetical protein [Desulfovibrio sp.]